MPIRKGRNPYLTETNDHGHRSEARIVKNLSAEQSPCSGGLAGWKGDFDLTVPSKNDFKGECKATTSKAARIDYEWLCKIRAEALEAGKYPVLTVSFVKSDGSAKENGDWAMIPLWLFKDLFGE
jgi:hypothetical protein